MTRYALWGPESDCRSLAQNPPPEVGIVAIFNDNAPIQRSPADHGSQLHTSALSSNALTTTPILIVGGNSKTAARHLLSIGIDENRLFIIKNGSPDPLANSISSLLSTHDQRLTDLHNRHTGRRAFILGNGPSLKIPDLHRLTNEITFASNKIYLAFEQTTWRPTYFTVCDQLVAANNQEAINRVPSIRLLPSSMQSLGCEIQNGYWYEERFENKFISLWPEQNRDNVNMFFSRDIRFGVHGGYTVIYHQLQLAYYMGIREVYLIGVDFSFTLPAKSATDDRFASPVYRNALEGTGEVNHFHPDYRKPGEKWSMPRLDLQHHAFRSARSVFESQSGSLVNASRSTKLTVLPCSQLEDILNA